MEETCRGDFQGFPIQVTGFTGISGDLAINAVIPNDIRLQFSPTQTPMAYSTADGFFNLPGSTQSFFMGGVQYNVQRVRLSKPGQQGLRLSSATPIAELHIWGSPSFTAITNPSLAVLIIPIFEKQKATSAGSSIFNAVSGKAVRLVDMIPKDKDTTIARYTTCIETDKKSTIQIHVGYWSKGVDIAQATMKSKFLLLKDFGIPKLSDYKILTTFTETTTGKNNRNYQLKYNNTVCVTYSKSAISASGEQFKKGVRFITDASSIVPSSSAAVKISANNDKWKSFDRNKYVVNGKIVIDATTGEPIEKSQLQTNTPDKPVPESSIKPTIIYTIIGIIIGLALLALFFKYLIYPIFFNKKSQLPSPAIATVSANNPTAH